jgi:hypothetical protein
MNDSRLNSGNVHYHLFQYLTPRDAKSQCTFMKRVLKKISGPKKGGSNKRLDRIT